MQGVLLYHKRMCREDDRRGMIYYKGVRELIFTCPCHTVSGRTFFLSFFSARLIRVDVFLLSAERRECELTCEMIGVRHGDGR